MQYTNFINIITHNNSTRQQKHLRNGNGHKEKRCRWHWSGIDESQQFGQSYSNAICFVVIASDFLWICCNIKKERKLGRLTHKKPKKFISHYRWSNNCKRDITGCYVTTCYICDNNAHGYMGMTTCRTQAISLPSLYFDMKHMSTMTQKFFVFPCDISLRVFLLRDV